MNLAYRLAQGAVARPDLPASLSVNPERGRWVSWCPDGSVEIRSGKVEIGQGILTALAQIAAQCLSLPIERIRMVAASTDHSPDEAVTSGSLSVQESGTAIRIVCAELRERLIERAAEHWGVSPSACEAIDGAVCERSGPRRIDYHDLHPNALLEGEVAGEAATRLLADTLFTSSTGPIGASVARRDLPLKLRGAPVYVHDLTLPDMVHARIMRAPLPGATLVEIDRSAVAKLSPGVQLWRDGDFVALTSKREWMVVKAAAALEPALTWQVSPLAFDDQSVAQWLRDQPVDSKVIALRGEASAPVSAPQLDALYAKPFIAHASIMPSCALARWSDNKLEVWSHSQGIFNLRADLTLLFPDARITVHHREGAGCYGHNAADDAALDAALIARLCQAPVRLLWSRRDELVRSPLGSAMTMRVQAWLTNGRITRWEHDVWSGGHSLRPGRAPSPTLLAATEIGSNRFAPRESVNAALSAGGGSERNAVPAYSFPTLKVTNHRIPKMPLRTSALRSLGAFGNVFALESSMDELAHLAGSDPFEFRLLHLEHPRARRVLETLRDSRGGGRVGSGQDATDSRAHPRPRRDEAAEPVAAATDRVSGFGIGFAHYKNSGAWCAVGAEIEVTDRIILRRLTVVADLGCVINPDGARNQLEGGALQACSWTLLESVPIDRDAGPLATDWSRYPILGFRDQPKVDVVLIDAPNQACLGAGECAHGPTAAAIANALFNAVGLRMRELPLSSERLREAASV